MKFHCVIDCVITPLEKKERQLDARYRHQSESFMSEEYETMKELFQSFQSEHGRCISKLFQTTADEEDIHTGWVFEKKDEYYDRDPGPRKYFIQETWVSLFDPCEHCNGRGHIPHKIEHPPWPPEEEQECSSPENPL
jgi:hypothetical protein